MARLLIALLSLFALSTVSADAEPGLYGGEWVVREIGGRPVAGKAPLTLGIAPDGSVSGSGGCNGFTGTADVDGDSITFPPFAATEKMCPPAVMIPEQEFLGALAATTSFRLDGSELLFYDTEGLQRLKLTRPK